jgi:hypothetical protein
MQAPDDFKSGNHSAANKSVPLSSEIAKALKSGKVPLSSHSKEIEAAFTALQSQYSFSDQASLDGGAKVPTLECIEARFEFTKLESDIEYRSLHVEPLLNQAANLLDRCLAARNERDELAIQKFNLERDLEEFFGTYEIYNREIEAGLYTIPYERAVYESLAESEAETYGDAARREIGQLIDRIVPNYEQERMLRYWGMLLPETSYPSYPTGAHNYNAEFGPYRGNKWEIAVPLLARLSDSEFSKELQILFAQYSSYRASAGASGFRKKAMQLMAEWNHNDIAFKRERKELALKIAAERAIQAVTDNGVLNYAVRKERIEQQFSLDFREALARLLAVQDGMKSIYGYGNNGHQITAKSTIDEAVLWTRTAINWLVRFSQLEQNFVLPVSISQLCPDWKTRSSDITFELKEDSFKNQRNVRLRGLGAAVLGSNANGMWQISVTVPRKSRMIMLDGTAVDIDQGSVPSCILNRVTNRYGFRDTDIVGINALHNAGPLGIWTISIPQQSNEGIPTRGLSDLQLDLHLAVRMI